MSALAAPGEAVGVLAAQSVGEPSTQVGLARQAGVCCMLRFVCKGAMCLSCWFFIAC